VKPPKVTHTRPWTVGLTRTSQRGSNTNYSAGTTHRGRPSLIGADAPLFADLKNRDSLTAALLCDINAKLVDLEAAFELRGSADQRAIEMWQEKTAVLRF
jgi:hypothetical protein